MSELCNAAQCCGSSRDVDLDIVSDDTLMDYLKSQKYDLALGEVWTVCPFSLFEALGIRTRIATLAVPMSSEVADLYGIPSPLSFIPCKYVRFRLLFRKDELFWN